MNYNSIVFILILCTVYWIARNMYNNKLVLKYRLKLLVLNQKIKIYSTEKNKKEWIFEDLENTIETACEQMGHINLFVIILSRIINRKKKNRVNQYLKKKNKELKSNHKADEFYNEFKDLMVEYFFERHFVIKYTLILIFHVVALLKKLKLHNSMGIVVKYKQLIGSNMNKIFAYNKPNNQISIC